MDDKKELPERFPCSGCAFSYTVGRGKGEFKGQMVIRKHNSRTGPGLCDGALKLPKTADQMEQELNPVAMEEQPAGTHHFERADEDAFTAPAHVRTMDGLAVTKQAPAEHLFTDPSGTVWSHPGTSESCVLPECVLARPADPHAREATAAIAAAEADRLASDVAYERSLTDDQFAAAVTASERPIDPFQAPAAAVPEPVSGQPEPERDRWGRYMLPLGRGGKLVGTTRATTFAKSTSDTFNLSQWGDRMVIRGLTLRADLLALAHGLDVKKDRDRLNSIAEQAKEAAGNKVAANLGTALHAFSERLDAGLMGVTGVPVQYQRQMQLYADTVRSSGLKSRPEWIERTTAVTVQGTRPGVTEDVAGTLDRVFQLPNGDLVIGDLKTGADLTFGWGEIAVQLALYAHGVNQRGLYDHRTKTWEQHELFHVRTDFAIVMHLPADPTEGGKYPDRGPSCELYWVDLREGWDAAGLNADVRAWRKTKNLARPLRREDLSPGGIWNPQEGVVVEPGTTYQVEQIRPEPAPGIVQVSEAAASHLHTAIAQADESLKRAREAQTQEAQARWQLAEKHFRSATSREALKQLWQYATDCGHFSEDQVNRLTSIGMEQLNLLEPSPS